MKVVNVYRPSQRSPEDKAKDREVREMFRDWKPGPEELLASGRWTGPVIVDGQQEFWKAIGRARAFREAQGITLKEVSERCGIDVATLSKLENGKQANPTLFTMLLYFGALGKRLHFAVRDRSKLATTVTEIRENSGAANGRQVGRVKAKVQPRKRQRLV